MSRAAWPRRRWPPPPSRRPQDGQAPRPAGSAAAGDPEPATHASRVVGSWPAGRKHTWTLTAGCRAGRPGPAGVLPGPRRPGGVGTPAAVLSRALEAGSFALSLPRAGAGTPAWTHARHQLSALPPWGAGSHAGCVLSRWGHRRKARQGRLVRPGSPPGPAARVDGGWGHRSAGDGRCEASSYLPLRACRRLRAEPNARPGLVAGARGSESQEGPSGWGRPHARPCTWPELGAGQLPLAPPAPGRCPHRGRERETGWPLSTVTGPTSRGHPRARRAPARLSSRRW